MQVLGARCAWRAVCVGGYGLQVRWGVHLPRSAKARCPLPPPALSVVLSGIAADHCEGAIPTEQVNGMSLVFWRMLSQQKPKNNTCPNSCCSHWGLE